jgi:hypothetical protein
LSGSRADCNSSLPAFCSQHWTIQGGERSRKSCAIAVSLHNCCIFCFTLFLVDWFLFALDLRLGDFALFLVLCVKNMDHRRRNSPLHRINSHVQLAQSRISPRCSNKEQSGCYGVFLWLNTRGLFTLLAHEHTCWSWKVNMFRCHKSSSTYFIRPEPMTVAINHSFVSIDLFSFSFRRLIQDA